MKGKANVIKFLNEALCAELTTINRYFVHSKMLEDWGYMKLAKKAHEESIEEMHHASVLIERVLFLQGVPNMQKYNPIDVGTTVREQFENDLKHEYGAQKLYNKASQACREAGDNGSADLFETLLKDEEGHIDWLEAQLHLIDEIGLQNYLAQQLGGGE
jgi:bacterioferritin